MEVEAVFRKHHALLRQIFQVYARITPESMTVAFKVFHSIIIYYIV